MVKTSKGFFDWVELVLSNKLLTALIIAGFTSLVTNASQFATNADHEAEKIASEKQIAMIANHYAKKPETKKIVKKTHKTDCGQCRKLISSHIKELH